VPDALVAGLAGSGGAIGTEETAVVDDLGASLLAGLPDGARASVEPFVGAIVDGIYGAVSVATGNVFWIGIGAVAVAFVVLLPLREVPLPRRVRAGAQATEAEPDTPAEGFRAEPA
jgi:hypothetical protein